LLLPRESFQPLARLRRQVYLLLAVGMASRHRFDWRAGLQTGRRGDPLEPLSPVGFGFILILSLKPCDVVPVWARPLKVYRLPAFNRLVKLEHLRDDQRSRPGI